MPYKLNTTSGGNSWLDGSGTFAQIVEGLKAIAQNRDRLDDTLIADKAGAAGVLKLSSIPSGTTSVDQITTPDYYTVLGSNAVSMGFPSTQGGRLTVEPWGSVVFQTYKTATETFQRMQGSSGWNPWVRLSPESNKPVPSSGIDSLTSFGVYEVLSGSSATSLGLPIDAGGILEVTLWGRYAYQTYHTVDGVYRRWQGSTAWHPWTRIDALDLEGRVRQVVDESSSAGGDGGPASGFKVLPASLTLGTGSGTGPLKATVRYPYQVNAPVTRWRMCIANRNPRYSTTGLAKTTPVSFSDLWVGIRASGSGDSSDLKRAASIPSIATGQSETATPWISDLNIGDNRSVVFSFSYTAEEAPHVIAGGGWQSETGGQESASSFSGARRTGMPFHIWLEVETYSFTPSIAGFGDSLTCGVGATLPVHDSWVSQHARKISAIPVHYSSSGDYMGGYEDESMLKWQLWSHLDKPDSVVWGMGSNDVFSGTALSELQRRHAAVAPLVRKYISPTVYGATIMPRTITAPGTQEETRRSYNNWLKTLPNGIRDVFDFASSVSSDDETIRPEFDSDGIHLTTSGYKANSDAITRQVTSPRVLTTKVPE